MRVAVLRKIFDSFDPAGKGSISTGTVGTIFTIMGLKVTDKALKRIIEEVDADGEFRVGPPTSHRPSSLSVLLISDVGLLLFLL